MLEKLHSAYRQKDWVTLKDELHGLKGMGGGFGYNVLTELAGKAEFQIFSENYDAAKHLLDEISQISKLIEQGLKHSGENVIHLEARNAG
jgi:HPt (histidine-containing phosphotransfer) domain-containing protein